MSYVLRIFAGLSLSLAALTDSAAQGVGGYLGQRHVLELGGDWYPFAGFNNTSVGAAAGASLEYAYVIRPQISLGAFVRTSSYETNQVRLDEQSRVRTRQFGVAFEFHGIPSGTSGSLAPLGTFFSVGVGYHTLDFSGAAPASDATVVENGAFVHVGGGYRYVLRDRFTVTPFVRLALGPSTLDPANDVMGASEWVQPGVRVGVIF